MGKNVLHKNFSLSLSVVVKFNFHGIHAKVSDSLLFAIVFFQILCYCYFVIANYLPDNVLVLHCAYVCSSIKSLFILFHLQKVTSGYIWMNMEDILRECFSLFSIQFTRANYIYFFNDARPVSTAHWTNVILTEGVCPAMKRFWAHWAQ